MELVDRIEAVINLFLVVIVRLLLDWIYMGIILIIEVYDNLFEINLFLNLREKRGMFHVKHFLLFFQQKPYEKN